MTEISKAERAKPLEAAFDTFAYNTHNMLTGQAQQLAALLACCRTQEGA